MSAKTLIWIGILIGSTIGSWAGALLDHGNYLGLWSIMLGGAGAILGVWAGYKISQL